MVFLILTNTDLRLAWHFHIHHLLLYAGAMYVGTGQVTWDQSYFILFSVYCNSLLASLNVRNTIRSRGSSYPGMPLRPISSLNTPTAGKVRPVGSAPELRAISISRTPEQNGSSVLVPPPPTYIGVRPSGGQHSPPRLSLRLNLDGRNESGLSGSVP